ncbi:MULTISPECIES: quinone oxidoreductase family protein [Streptomycetaceae]|uniref:quinone oxidoreductase family protein n=1 Tax=Streptomycetaceae TaxID=2062 RepID=UPI00093DC948|nr:zinc-binding dehydrogenase [Streptomyces sp. CB02056]OKI01736.1 oxidoreductase [Streptomyces sp. CB02056]
MRALVMTAPGGAENSEVREVPVPHPGPGQVAVDVAHAGLNFVDVMTRRGDAAYAAEWPYRPGKEVSGTVRELGAGVTGLAVGDRVVAAPVGAGLAEVVVAEAALTVPLPDGVALREAAAVPLGLATSMLLLTDAGRFTAGDTVLVHSAGGGIGNAVARLVPLLGGGRLIGTVGRPEKAAAALASGYDHVFARGAADGPGADGPGADGSGSGESGSGGGPAEAIRAATSGRGVDLVLDPLGTAALDLDLAVAAPGARIVLFGNAGGGAVADLPPLGRLMAGNLTVTGFSHRGLAATAPERLARAVRRVLDLLADGGLDLPVTELPGLDAVPAAHDAMQEGRATGKYVVRVGG